MSDFAHANEQRLGETSRTRPCEADIDADELSREALLARLAAVTAERNQLREMTRAMRLRCGCGAELTAVVP